MINNVSIWWVRLDLRLADNPALLAAIRHGGPVIPVFIPAPDEEKPWPPGGASNWWLHHSLVALDKNLRALGSKIIFRRGPTLETLLALVKETGATGIFWNRRYEPAVIARDAKIKDALRAGGLQADSYNAALLFEPWTVKNKSEKPFQVFSPFWKHCLVRDEPHTPLRAPEKIPAPAHWPASLAVEELALAPKINWAEGFRSTWQPGEIGAQAKLKNFLSAAFANYSDQRNRPDITGTSRLSPHLHFGEISPRQIWHALKQFSAQRGLPAAQWHGSQFLAEVGWREFAHQLLFHFPRTTDEPLRREFEKFPWREDQKLLRRWQQGQTGYPIVDAGLRELWATGWMHNRVRMIVASFLVKDLLLPWQAGAQWFWDTLVDADLAQNSLGWQWTAGCGADAAPYFRVFNPTTQGEKFDPDGDYVRRWCPELAHLPAEWIHEPPAAPAEILRAARVEIGKNYPAPIVDHAAARDVALKSFAQIKS